MMLKAAMGVCLAVAVSVATAQDMGAGRGMGRGMGQGMGGGMMGMMGGRGLMGTVVETAADHLTLKTYMNEIYVVHVGVNTRFVKSPAGGGMGRGRGDGMRRGEGGMQPGMGGGQGMGMGMTEIKATEIKKGDDVAVMGEIDPVKKEAGAMAVAVIDPERARAMKEMAAGYGKSWVMGKVTAIDGVKLTILGGMDNQPHVIVADENTTLRKRREPVTLADIQVGDQVRAEGSVKGASFAATTIQVMGVPQGGAGRMPRDGQGPQQ
jgi:hypothetical protein